jgi:hypothetical protein
MDDEGHPISWRELTLEGMNPRRATRLLRPKQSMEVADSRVEQSPEGGAWDKLLQLSAGIS